MPAPAAHNAKTTCLSVVCLFICTGRRRIGKQHYENRRYMVPGRRETPLIRASSDTVTKAKPFARS